MTALPLPSAHEPDHLRGPYRRRRDLVPLGGTETPLGQTDEPWYLGATGDIAHLPAPIDTGMRGTLRLMVVRCQPHQETRCGVFLTQVPAGSGVPRCPLCQALRHEDHERR